MNGPEASASAIAQITISLADIFCNMRGIAQSDLGALAGGPCLPVLQSAPLVCDPGASI